MAVAKVLPPALAVSGDFPFSPTSPTISTAVAVVVSGGGLVPSSNRPARLISLQELLRRPDAPAEVRDAFGVREASGVGFSFASFKVVKLSAEPRDPLAPPSFDRDSLILKSVTSFDRREGERSLCLLTAIERSVVRSDFEGDPS